MNVQCHAVYGCKPPHNPIVRQVTHSINNLALISKARTEVGTSQSLARSESNTLDLEEE